MKPVLENLTIVSPSFTHFLIQKAAKSSIKQDVSVWVNHYVHPPLSSQTIKILDNSDSKATEGFSDAEEYKLSRDWFEALNTFDSEVFRVGLNYSNIQQLRDKNLNQILTELESYSPPNRTCLGTH